MFTVQVIPPPFLRRYSGGTISVAPYADTHVDELMDWHPSGLPEPVVKLVVFDVLSGLVACHSKNICHGNVRPEVSVSF